MNGRIGWRGLLCCGFLSMVGCSREPKIDGRSMGQWMSQLRNPEWAARNHASDVLAREGAKSLPYLAKYLRADDPGTRRAVVETIGKMGELARPEVPALLRHLAVEQVAVIRAEILKTLLAIAPQGPEVAAELNKRLRDESPDVREAAQAALLAIASAQKPAAEAAVNAARSPGVSTSAEDLEELALLRDAVQAHLKAQPFGLAGGVLRDNRRAALVWTGLKPGTREPRGIAALIFEQEGSGAYGFQREVTDLARPDGSERLSGALGGADKQRLVRACGVPRDRLAALLGEQGRAFDERLAAGKGQEAMAAYEELTRAFSFRLNVYQDLVPRMLAERSFVNPGWKFSVAPEGDNLPVELSSKGVVTKGQLRLEPCGPGLVIAEVKEGA